MTTHTPGPWTHDAGATGAVVYQETSGTIATIPMDLIAFRANARLIGAAPDLLAALRAMLATVHDEERDDATVAAVAAARAAIAKATGEA